ncbi:MAG TPA: glycoside hydrolase family 3 N-terminal domain-containing protein [Ignavibacteriaceae bacterium]|nr:glycoside hydrolase family 3 N-terminal domain-containing protein [Ignavibacteriaceae bacterium]
MKSENKIEFPSVFPLTQKDKKWIEDQLAKMTTREKCAQMIVPLVYGKDYSKDTASLNKMIHYVKDLKVGGLLYSLGDVFNEAVSINKMQELAEIPLLISADFESGLGMRLSDGTGFPYNMALAATGDTSFAFKMGKIVARESRAIGVLQNYAPDVDINNNPDNPIINIRSYSEDKKIVSKFAEAFIKGSLNERVITTAKHFPGQGNTVVDSHLDLPVVEGDSTDLMKNEIYPFIRAIKAGVQSIMIGHLSVPSLEKNKIIPSSLSRSIVTNLLKDKLGFDGLIVTDALDMQAVTKYFSESEAVKMAVKAGNDILLMPPDVDIALDSLVGAVQSGEIEIKRINESVVKILSAKRWLKLQDNKFVNIDKLKDRISTKENIKLSELIADRSITLIKNSGKYIPLKPLKYKNVLSVVFTFGIEEDSALTFQTLVKEKFNNPSIFILNNNSSSKQFSDVLAKAKRSDLILVPYFMRPPSDDKSEILFKKFNTIIDRLLAAKAPTILLSFGDPYLLSRYVKSRTYLSAFSDSPVSQKAMIKALLGEIKISGRLPISLPGTKYKIGYGKEFKIPAKKLIKSN